MRRARILACIVPVAFAAGATAQTSAHPDQIEFKFNFKPGHAFTQKIVSRNVGAITLPPPAPEMKMSQTLEETLISRCVKVNDDGSGEFEMTIDAMAMKMTIGGLNVNYDSRTYDPNAKSDWVTGFISKIFNAMKGAKFNVTLSSTGQAIKMQGLSEALKKMAASIGDGNKEAAAAKGMFDQFSSMMDDDGMQELQSMYRLVPSKPGPYRVGDKWDHSWKMKLPGLGSGVTGRGDYELIAIETFRGRPCAKIRAKESFDFATPQPGDKSGSQPENKNSALASILGKLDMKISSNGGDGYAYVDYRTGETIQMRSTQNITLNITLKPDAQAKTEKEQQGMQFTQSFRTSVLADLVEQNAAGTAPSDKVSGSSVSASKAAEASPRSP